MNEGPVEFHERRKDGNLLATQDKFHSDARNR
jgi:hypothetical protein